MSEQRCRDTPATRSLAEVERKLRATDGVTDVEVQAGPESARLYWDTWTPNESTRGEVLAGVCRAVAQSVDWRLVTVHDPMEREQHISNCVTLARSDDPLTIRYDPAHGPARRTTFAPVDEALQRGYRRREWEWTGCQWRHAGGEIVDDVVVDHGAGADR